jgi:integrase
MGRKPTRKDAIPRFRPRKRGRVTYYFYDHGICADGKRREESLGTDYGLAIKKWAELERASDLPPPAIVTFKHVAEHYRRDVIPTKAERTQQDNAKELANLLAFFDDPPCPFEGIEAGDVQDYMNWRIAAPVRATREKALLSHIWNWARSQRYTNQPNPCEGIKGTTAGRDAYVEASQYRAIWNAGSPMLRDAMDIAYLTGQRNADVLKLSLDDVREGSLHVRQGKTKAKVRIEIVGELEEVLNRILDRKRTYTRLCSRLVVNTYGKAVDGPTLRRHWRAACAAAAVEGLQFRDLRAKAATDTEEATGNVREAQRQLGHKSVRTTEGYVRNRRGAKVLPTGFLRKGQPIAEKRNAPEGASNMEAEVGIEPAYADLQSD